jgi:hypothetical protein
MVTQVLFNGLIVVPGRDFSLALPGKMHYLNAAISVADGERF